MVNSSLKTHLLVASFTRQVCVNYNKMLFSISIFQTNYFLQHTRNADFTFNRRSPPEIFCKKGVITNQGKTHAKYTEKHLRLHLRVSHGCFPANFAKLLGALFLIEDLRWLLLFQLYLIKICAVVCNITILQIIGVLQLLSFS